MTLANRNQQRALQKHLKDNVKDLPGLYPLLLTDRFALSHIKS